MLTFLGVLQYDSTTDKTTLSDPLAFIGGGKRQSLDFLEALNADVLEKRNIFLFLSGLCFSYLGLKAWNYLAAAASSYKQNKMKNLKSVEDAEECLICMEY